jgi:glycosyltransferase involved in cell wall biosynthesis
MIDPPASPPAPLRFVVITAVRDEERFLPRTIASMRAQTVLPAAWIVVDDGSTDGTPGLLAEAAAGTSWIRVVTIPREPRASSGEAASLAFNRVYPISREFDPDAIAMLDGDTEFEPDFYERLLGALSADPRLGIVGADALEPHANGTWGRVRIPHYHVHGAVKVYRRGCIELIGGLEPGIAWDTVDIVRARLRGWDTRTLPDVTFRHLRVTGSAGGLSRGPWIRGRAAYLAGYHPLFALARAGRNMFRPPLVSGGFHFLRGFLSGYRERARRMLLPEEIRAFRHEQMRALTGRKSWWR